MILSGRVLHLGIISIDQAELEGKLQQLLARTRRTF
jgi:hypothetical protein